MAKTVLNKLNPKIAKPLAPAKPLSTVRSVSKGDRAPSTAKGTLANFVSNEATLAAQGKQAEAAVQLLEGSGASAHRPTEDRAKALRALFDGASPDDRRALRKALLDSQKKPKEEKINPDEVLAPDWRDGGYPYQNLLRRSVYEKQTDRQFNRMGPSMDPRNCPQPTKNPHPARSKVLPGRSTTKMRCPGE